MKNPAIAAVLIVSILGSIFAWTASRDASHATADDAAKSGNDDNPAVSTAADDARVGRAPDSDASPRVVKLPTPADVAAAKAARIAELESKVVSEPVSAAWASENAARIRSFLQADNLRATQLPEVDYVGVDCRTTICRIELQTRDDLAAGELTQGILQQIAEQMPSAQIFQADGKEGTKLLIFSTASAVPRKTSFGSGPNR